ncbi:MAG: Uma2 family endonuclease [Pyrinomonadaceae bacterium]
MLEVFHFSVLPSVSGVKKNMVWVNTSPLVKTYMLDEFWQLPDPPDGSKLELIAGALYVTPPPDYTHNEIVTRLIRLFTLHLVSIGDRGKLYVPRAAIWTGPNTWVEPDLFYISAELAARMGQQRPTSADFVVEVISPGSAIYDRNMKAGTYEALGVRELWLIDETSRTIEVRSQTGSGFDGVQVFSSGREISSQIFPDLQLQVAKLFID